MMTTPDIGSDKSSDGAEVIAFVDDLISYYGNRAEKYGRRLWTYKSLGLFFSVSVTVISGISAVKDGWPWVITIVAGLATFFTGMLTLSKAQEYYLNAGSQHGKVDAEKLLFLGGGGPYATATSPEAKIRLLAERVQAIYNQGREDWEGVNRPKVSTS